MRPRFTKMTTQNDHQVTTANILNINKLCKKNRKVVKLTRFFEVSRKTFQIPKSLYMGDHLTTFENSNQ